MIDQGNTDLSNEVLETSLVDFYKENDHSYQFNLVYDHTQERFAKALDFNNNNLISLQDFKVDQAKVGELTDRVAETPAFVTALEQKVATQAEGIDFKTLKEIAKPFKFGGNSQWDNNPLFREQFYQQLFEKACLAYNNVFADPNIDADDVRALKLNASHSILLGDSQQLALAVLEKAKQGNLSKDDLLTLLNGRGYDMLPTESGDQNAFAYLKLQGLDFISKDDADGRYALANKLFKTIRDKSAWYGILNADKITESDAQAWVDSFDG